MLMPTLERAGSSKWAVMAMLAGLGLVLIAALVPNNVVEAAFGRSPGSLEWGPSLFRILLVFHGLFLATAAFLRIQAPVNGPVLMDVREQETGGVIWLILGAVCLLALVLRLVGLNSGLWFDEIATLLDWVRAKFGVVLTSLPNQNNHILFTILAKGFVELFGEHAWSVRLPSVLFGIGSVWALFMLGRRVIGNREALLSSALLAVSYHHIWFSQNARGYSGLLFFSILTTWIWLEALPRKSLGLWLAYATGVSLGMWVHLTMAFVVASHGLVYLVLAIRLAGGEREQVSGIQSFDMMWLPLLGFAFSVSLTLQLYALPLPEFLSEGLHEISLPSAWVSPFWLIVETVRGLVAGFSGGILYLGAAMLLGGAIVGLCGWLSIFRKEWYVAVAMILPGLLILSLMVILGHNLWPRFLFFSAGFALLIGVHGAFTASRYVMGLVTSSGTKERAAIVSGYILCGLMIAASLASLPRYYALPKQDYEGARAWVERNRELGEIVVTAGLAATAYTKYYAPAWIGIESAAELDTIRSNHKRIWFVYSLPVHFASHHPDLLRVLESDFEIVRVFPGTLNGGEVYVYRERVGSVDDAGKKGSGTDVRQASGAPLAHL